MVLEFLVQQQALSEGLRSRMLGWRQEGPCLPSLGHGPMRIIALINDPPVVRRILEHLALCGGVESSPSAAFCGRPGSQALSIVRYQGQTTLDLDIASSPLGS